VVVPLLEHSNSSSRSSINRNSRGLRVEKWFLKERYMYRLFILMLSVVLLSSCQPQNIHHWYVNQYVANQDVTYLQEQRPFLKDPQAIAAFFELGKYAVLGASALGLAALASFNRIHNWLWPPPAPAQQEAAAQQPPPGQQGEQNG